jgi:hypothetical protein
VDGCCYRARGHALQEVPSRSVQIVGNSKGRSELLTRRPPGSNLRLSSADGNSTHSGLTFDATIGEGANEIRIASPPVGARVTEIDADIAEDFNLDCRGF